MSNQIWEDTLRRLVDDLCILVGESDGVYGLHKNGDLSPWSEILPGGSFVRLSAMQDAVALCEGERYEFDKRQRMSDTAPEMLDALKDSLALIELGIPFEGAVTRKIRSVISKATGEGQ